MPLPAAPIETLAERNKERYGELLQWIQDGIRAGEIRRLPSETYASLLIGQSGELLSAWLSGRVKGSPLPMPRYFPKRPGVRLPLNATRGHGSSTPRHRDRPSESEPMTPAAKADGQTEQ